MRGCSRLPIAGFGSLKTNIRVLIGVAMAFTSADLRGQRPGGPTVAVYPGEESLSVYWTPEEEHLLGHYNSTLRYRAGDSGGWTRLTDVGATDAGHRRFHVLTELTDETSYQIQVRYDVERPIDLRPSNWSEVVTATPQDAGDHGLGWLSEHVDGLEDVATPLPLGVWLRGEIGTVTDLDYYKVTMPSAGTCVFFYAAGDTNTRAEWRAPSSNPQLKTLPLSFLEEQTGGLDSVDLYNTLTSNDGSYPFGNIAVDAIVDPVTGDERTAIRYKNFLIDIVWLGYTIEYDAALHDYHLRVSGESDDTGEYFVYAEVYGRPGVDDLLCDISQWSSARKVYMDVPVLSRYNVSDTDFFTFQTVEETDVLIHGLNRRDSQAVLYSQRAEPSDEIGRSNISMLPTTRHNFLFREILREERYYLSVRSRRATAAGIVAPFRIWTVTEPGSTPSEAVHFQDPGNLLGRYWTGGTPAREPVGGNLGTPLGGNIGPADDQDYFSFDVPAGGEYVFVRGMSDHVPIAGEITDDTGSTGVPVYPAEQSNGAAGLVYYREQYWKQDPVTGDPGPYGFTFAGWLPEGLHYLVVTGDGVETGGYTVAVAMDRSMKLLDACGTPDAEADPGFGCGWHLENGPRYEGDSDVNVQGAWDMGYDGTGQAAVVVDIDLDVDHPDLRTLPDLSHDYSGSGTLRSPGGSDHGTAVAGVIAARARNGIGGRGVAPGASLIGYNLLAGSFTDTDVSFAMTGPMHHGSASNNSWGPIDGPGVNEPSQEWKDGVVTAVTEGNEGRGVVFLFAAGNGATSRDYGNLDGYSTFFPIIAVCATTSEGQRSYYSEKGSNLWICGPSNDLWEKPSIFTTAPWGRYRDSFGGTSAAAPAVTGVVLLMREANPSLSWRDVKLILAETGAKPNAGDSGWSQGASLFLDATQTYSHHHEYGFGIVDAEAAVTRALTWQNLTGDLIETEQVSMSVQLTVPDDAAQTVTSTIQVTDSPVQFIEHVEVALEFDASHFRNLRVELESPSGTVSILSQPTQVSGPEAETGLGALVGTFETGTARHLGEDPNGVWTLRVRDEMRDSHVNTFQSWGLRFYGHRREPTAVREFVDLWAQINPTTFEAEIDLLWLPPEHEGLAEVDRYDLRHRELGTTTWTQVDDVWPATSLAPALRFSGLEQAMTYEIQIRPVNDYGPAPWSRSLAVPTPGLIVVNAPRAIEEGGRAEYTVALNTKPVGPVEVQIFVPAGAELEARPGSLIFVPATWNRPQTVRLYTKEDEDALPEDEIEISHVASGADYGNALPRIVPVQIVEDDAAELVLDNWELFVPEGEQARYGLRLGSKPTDAVVVRLELHHDEATVHPLEFAFTPDNWLLRQYATVVVAEDEDAVIDAPATLTHRMLGGDYEGLSAEMTLHLVETDVPLVWVEGASAAENEGAIVFDVVLGMKSSSEITVHYVLESHGAAGATPGEDFEGTGGSVTFPPETVGERRITVPLFETVTTRRRRRPSGWSSRTPRTRTCCQGGHRRWGRSSTTTSRSSRPPSGLRAMTWLKALPARR